MTQDQLLIVLILLACVFTGLTDARDAFLGFAHPAVVTVACVLVLSIAALTGLGALLSGFINNVAATALLMPVVRPM